LPLLGRAWPVSIFVLIWEPTTKAQLWFLARQVSYDSLAVRSACCISSYQCIPSGKYSKDHRGGALEHSAPRESNPGVVWKGRLAACLQRDHVRRARRGVHPWIGAPLYWTDLDPSALCWRCDRRPRCRPRPPTSASNSFLPLPILSPPVLFCAIPTPRPFNTGNPHLPSATQHRPCAFGTASDRLSNAAWCLRVIFE